MEAFDRLDGLLQNRGTIYEGEILHFLKRAVNYLVRAFEFGLVDGALAVDQEFAPEASFADIFWKVDNTSRGLDNGYTLLLFDIKSRLSGVAGDAIHVTSDRQASQAAFFLGFCAADPRFIELIPNYKQNPGRTQYLLQQPSRYAAVNSSRISRFSSRIYGLDPSSAPCRMPLAYLPKALNQLREDVRNNNTFVNPYTQVPFPDWPRYTTTSSEYLTPKEDCDQYSGFEAILDLYRRIKWSQKPLSLDFMCLQPRVADFKLIRHDIDTPCQYFIQHKLDGRQRAWDVPLSKVFIARGDDPERGWYFTHTDR